MASRFVRPESVRLSISGGDFIDIKKRLNHGEQEELHARWSPFVTPGEPTALNRREVRTAKVLAYLLGWSLTDEGTPVPMSLELPENKRRDILGSLDVDTFSEIHQAIEAHEVAMAEERDEAKKKTAGTVASEQTGPLPSKPASRLPTSETLMETITRY